MAEFEFHGGFADLAVSTRVRLARNFKGYTYRNLTAEKQKEIADKIWNAINTAPAISKQLTFTEIKAGSNEALSKVETHQISTELAQNGGYLIATENGGVSIMIGEEDHMRLQVMGSGLCPKECMQEASRLASLIESQIPMDYDTNLGYLTACPSNIGTGLRASVMLHLPMLESAGGISELVNLAGRQGFTVRGAYGEGSRAVGGFYQLSNQVTLGVSEDNIIEKLIKLCTEVIEKEKNLRHSVSSQYKLELTDKVCRAVGTLKTARQMQTNEAIDCLSQVLIGISMKYLDGVKPEEIWKTEQRIQPVVLGGTANERDKKRADILRDLTKSLEIII